MYVVVSMCVGMNITHDVFICVTCLYLFRVTRSKQLSVRSPERGADRLTESECLRAWLRDISGHNGVESFKTRHYNRKTGAYEDRQCVWVHVGFNREKYEDECNKKSVKLKQISKDPNEVQVKEALMKVASFESWLHL